MNRKDRRAMKGNARNFETPSELKPCYGKIFQNGEVAIFPARLKMILRGLGYDEPEKIIKTWEKLGILEMTQSKGAMCDTEIGERIAPMYRFAAGTLHLPESIFNRADDRNQN